MMRGLGQNPSEEELQELIDSVDEGEKDGQIQLREFIKLYTMSLDNKNATSNTEVNDCFATFGGDPRDKASKITSAAVRVAPTSLLLCFFLCVISLLLTPPPQLRNFILLVRSLISFSRTMTSTCRSTSSSTRRSSRGATSRGCSSARRGSRGKKLYAVR